MADHWYKRPKPRRRVIITAIVLLVLGLSLSFVPTYLARYFITGILDDFGIRHDGIKTLKINVWKRQVWVGPIQFHTGDSDPGKLGEFGVKLRLFPAVKKHALVEKVLIRGIDLYVARDKDQALILNGIPLDQFSPTADTTSSTQVDQEQSWGAGLIDLEVQDSQVIFKEDTGGTLTLKVERLHLDNFMSWEPDEPGNIELNASVNGIKIDLVGQVRPFARHISASLQTKIQQADLAKIIEFIGPVGLQKSAGVYTGSLQHELTLFESGRLEGHSIGQVNVLGVDYEKTNQFAIAVKQADIELDTRYSLNETKDLSIEGKIDMALTNVSGQLQGKKDFTAESAKAKIAQFNTSLDSDMALYVKANPHIDIRQAAFSGEVQLSMDALLNVLRYLQSISAKQKVSKVQTKLEEWADEEIVLPESDILVQQFVSNAKSLELKTADGGVTLKLEADSEAKAISVTTEERRTDIEFVHSKLDSLKLRSGDDNLMLNLIGSNEVTGFNIKGPIGTGRVQGLELSQQIELGINKGDINLTGSANAGINAARLAVFKTDILPPASVEVGAISAAIKQANFSLANETMLWKFIAATSIDKAEVEFAKDSLTSAKIQRFEVKGAQADQDLNFVTDELTIKGLDASVTRQLIDGVISGSGKGAVKKDKQASKVAAEKSTTPASTQPTPQVKLNFFTAEGSKLRFRDEKVTPQVRLDLDIIKAEVRDVDTRNPRQQSKAKLEATINEFTRFELNGQGDNIGPALNLKLKGKLDDLELPPYSSYVAEFGGVDIDRGQFNSNIDLNANKGELDGLINLNIKGLEFTTLSAADAQRLSDTVGMPIETAANLLKDSHGNIDLSLPIAGSVAEPSVDISSAITKAIGSILKAVFPPTLIGSMLSAGQKEGAGLVFEPVIFEAGSSELDKNATQYLDGLVELFVDRPGLSVRICGRTTPKDFFQVTLISLDLAADAKPEAIKQREILLETHGQKLRELADERTQVVRRYLINKKGLSAKQVGQCRAIFNENDTAAPRVEVKL